jgi:tRNA nucleotidyltransferase (CCA-adding enzyme)
VHWVHGRFDVAERRAESYSAPGALPDVRPGTLKEDLWRRDFTINAIALWLGGPEAGELVGVAQAGEDLASGTMRVLHENSFIDDPTRLLRLARYSARLVFEIDPRTAALADAALAGGALRTISGGRVSRELATAALNCETETFVALSELGVLGALGLPPRFDAELADGAEAVMRGQPDGYSEDVLMAVAFHPPDDDGPDVRRSAAELLDWLEHPAAGREQILAGAFGVGERAAELRSDTRPSQLRRLFGDLGVDGVAIVGALAERLRPGASAAAELWLEELRHVSLQITGEDLLRAGIQQGPAIGQALDATLAARLDGELRGGRDAELHAALGVVGAGA